jgi:hypothetical protein
MIGARIPVFNATKAGVREEKKAPRQDVEKFGYLISPSVLRIRKCFFPIRIRGGVILTYEPGSRGP